MIIFIIDLSAENFHLLLVNQRAIAKYKTNYNESSNIQHDLLSLYICPRVTETEKSYRWRDSKLKFTSSLYLSESLHRPRQEEHNDIGGSYNGAINMFRSFTWEEEVLSFRCGYLCLASMSLQSQLLQLLEDVVLTAGGQTQNKFKHNSQTGWSFIYRAS